MRRKARLPVEERKQDVRNLPSVSAGVIRGRECPAHRVMRGSQMSFTFLGSVMWDRECPAHRSMGTRACGGVFFCPWQEKWLPEIKRQVHGETSVMYLEVDSDDTATDDAWSSEEEAMLEAPPPPKRLLPPPPYVPPSHWHAWAALMLCPACGLLVW